MSRITYDDVANAARRLAEAGERPSAPKIRRLLGDRGGMATIQKHLDAWRGTDEAQAAAAEELPELPEQLAADSAVLIQQIWGQAKKLADEELLRERERLAAEREEMQATLAETVAVSEDQEAQIESLKAQVDEQAQKLADETERADELAKQLTQATAETAVLAERCSQYEARIADAERREKELLSQIASLADGINKMKSGGH